MRAVLPLFAQKGFVGATTKELAAAAGVSEALLYRHFPSKEVLYREILRWGVQGDPLLLKLKQLEPSTSSLVHLVHLITQRILTGAPGLSIPWEIRHRLLAQSYLSDGEFAKAVFTVIRKVALPTFIASLKEAEASGDVAPSPITPANRFWFMHQLTAMIAFARMPNNGLPYETEVEELIHQAVSFSLRGIGMKDEAIKRYYNPRALALLQG